MPHLFSQNTAVIASLILIGSAPATHAEAPPATQSQASQSVSESIVADSSAISKTSDHDFEQRCRPLFDGTILSRWEGGMYWFHTDGNAIVAGRLEKPIPQNQFLCTMETFINFDLRMDVRMRGTGRNAGVQFRSRRARSSDDGIPRNEVIGYQADMGQAGNESIWGALYDESRRRKMLAVPEPRFTVKWTPSSPEHPAETDPASASDSTPQSEWVSLRIVCVDDQIEIFMNGRRTVAYRETDPSIPREGVIGLQIHSGPPSEAWYRNIRILSL
ncbi:protein of unknown function [Neorhodopirellula lusitana]|uniref:3-keto-alpha-glucoside-1,2-lyase/3-keto-2-hydroxy-glucal hydratase domain-containing protein n=1 Tax=Neorhodopirellula lusitana TaxID=445327 RepID=A0ABY1Q4N3_9BACT|nr:protein of unknown function [Neorhodopirellula lusitana]